MNNTIKKLEEAIGEDVLTEEVKEQIREEIRDIVETRVKARVNEARVEAKEEASEEYEEEIEEYNKALREEVQRFVEETEKEKETELKEHKEWLEDKINDFLEYKLEESIPEELQEAQAKIAVYEPIVEGIKDLFAENYLKADSEQYQVLQQARDEISKLRDQKSEKVAENIELKKQLKEKRRQDIINEACRDLTSKQEKRFKRFAQPFDTEELEEKWQDLVDEVVEEDVNKGDSRKNLNERNEDLSGGTEIVDGGADEDSGSEIDVYAEQYKALK